MTTYSYDGAGQLLSITATRQSDQVVVSSVAYAYDQAGNRTSMTDWAGTHTYGYDNLNRLISATHPAASNLPVLNETFTYDAVGNRLADAALTGYTYDAANRLKQNSGYTYGFDADGNLNVKTDSTTNQTSFGYDSQNEQTAVTTPAGNNWNYKYDTSGRRVARSSSTAVGEQFIYDQSGELLATLDLNNNPSFVYTSEPKIGAPLQSLRSDGARFFYHADALSSIVAHTDQNANPLDTLEYTAYGVSAIADAQGNRLNSPIPGDQRSDLGLTYDPESRTRLFGARPYDPSTGQFISEDPLLATPSDAASILKKLGALPDAYAYASGNPIVKSDPLGLYGTTACGYYGVAIARALLNRDVVAAAYYLTAYKVCSETLRTTYENCVRQCLQDQDQSAPSACAKKSVMCGGSDSASSSDFLRCQFDAHTMCFSYCDSNPAGPIPGK